MSVVMRAGVAPVVADGDGACDRRVVAQDGQPDRRLESTRRIEEVDLQRVGLRVVLRVRAGQPGSSGLPARMRCAR